jgi:adenine-specific DNA-methyltransferase
LLFAGGFGDRTSHLDLTITNRFDYSADPPKPTCRVTVREWENWHRRLRPFLLPASVRQFYRAVVDAPCSARLGTLAKVGIGYVTGANDFFHLRPSQAKASGISSAFLRPSVRNGRVLTGRSVTASMVQKWLKDDEQVLLLKLTADISLTAPVKRYLNSAAARDARDTYKCRHRSPWYAVPDVIVPDAFLAYMSGHGPALVANRAGCVGTNSVHTVNLTGDWSLPRLQRAWQDTFTSLSC